MTEKCTRLHLTTSYKKVNSNLYLPIASPYNFLVITSGMKIVLNPYE